MVADGIQHFLIICVYAIFVHSIVHTQLGVQQNGLGFFHRVNRNPQLFCLGHALLLGYLASAVMDQGGNCHLLNICMEMLRHLQGGFVNAHRMLVAFRLQALLQQDTHFF